MSRSRVRVAWFVGAALLLAAPGSHGIDGSPSTGRAHALDPAPVLLLDRATAKFLPADDGGPQAASVRIHARYDALAGPSYFQVEGDAVALGIAGATHRIATGDDGVRLGNKSTRLRYSRPRGAARAGLRSLFVDVVKGVVRTRVDLADASALAATGSWDVPFAVALGDETFSRDVDMRAMRQRRKATWRHRARDAGAHPIPYRGRTGFDTALTEPRNVVVRDVESWAALWAENGGEPEDLPEVDFEAEAVIGVFLGDRTGFTVSIDRTRRAKDRVDVVFTEHGPGRNCYVAQVVTQPYALAKIPAPDAPVEFRGRVRRAPCGR